VCHEVKQGGVYSGGCGKNTATLLHNDVVGDWGGVGGGDTRGYIFSGQEEAHGETRVET